MPEFHIEVAAPCGRRRICFAVIIKRLPGLFASDCGACCGENPAASVRGERLQAIEGKSPEITVQQVRRLLASIDTSHVIGLPPLNNGGPIEASFATHMGTMNERSRRLSEIMISTLEQIIAPKSAVDGNQAIPSRNTIFWPASWAMRGYCLMELWSLAGPTILAASRSAG